MATATAAHIAASLAPSLRAFPNVPKERKLCRPWNTRKVEDERMQEVEEENEE